MNYLRNLSKLIVVAMALTITIGACGSKQEESKSDDTKKAKDVPLDPSGKLSIRYVEEDSIIKNYNLAKDFKEMKTRLENEYDQAERRFGDQIDNFQKSMQQKYQNNQYTEATATADARKLEQMQLNASNELAKLSESSTNQLQQSQKQLNDSIKNFLREYANANHYDMILVKGKTAELDPLGINWLSIESCSFMNSNLDITKEVVDELNKRYTKVAPKK